MKYPNLIAEMARIKLTVGDLARDTGKSTDTIRNWLSGKSEFPLPRAFDIRKKYFPLLPLEYLFDTEPAIQQKEDMAYGSIGSKHPDAPRHRL